MKCPHLDSEVNVCVVQMFTQRWQYDSTFLFINKVLKSKQDFDSL